MSSINDGLNWWRSQGYGAGVDGYPSPYHWLKSEGIVANEAQRKALMEGWDTRQNAPTEWRDAPEPSDIVRIFDKYPECRSMLAKYRYILETTMDGKWSAHIGVGSRDVTIFTDRADNYQEVLYCGNEEKDGVNMEVVQLICQMHNEVIPELLGMIDTLLEAIREQHK